MIRSLTLAHPRPFPGYLCRIGDLGKLMTAPDDLSVGPLLGRAEQGLDVGTGPSGPVVPLDQVAQLLGPEGRCGTPPDRLALASVQRVPNQVEGALHALGIDGRDTTTRLQDRAHQARTGHRPASQVPLRQDTDSVVATVRIATDVPRVLHPARRHDVPCGRDELTDLEQLGDLCAQAILRGQPPALPPALPPPDVIDNG